MSNLHIHAPAGKYYGQIRLRGHRLWTTVGGAHKSAKAAMIKAVSAMGENHKRARVLFDVEWYGPTIVMEASKP